MDEAWERAVDAAVEIHRDSSSSSPSALKTLTLDGAVKCLHGRLPPANLLEKFQNLEILSLANIGLSSLENFPKLGLLQRLILSDNRIAGGLEFLVEAGLDSLRDLDLSNNRIQDLEDLAPLAQLKLVSLDLYECPVTRVKDYRSRVFGMIKSLKYLDKMDLDENEREDSDDEEEDEEEEEEIDGDGDEDDDQVTGEVDGINGVIDVDDEEEEEEEDDSDPNADVDDDVDGDEEEEEAEDGDANEIDGDDGEDEDVVEVHDVVSDDDDDVDDGDDDVDDGDGDDEVDEEDDDMEEVEDEDGDDNERSNGRLVSSENGEIDGHEHGEDDENGDEIGEVAEDVDAEEEEDELDGDYLVQPIPQNHGPSNGVVDCNEEDEEEEVDDEETQPNNLAHCHPSSSSSSPLKRRRDKNSNGSSIEKDLKKKRN